MSSDLTVFNFDNSQVRTVLDNTQSVWFVGRDVAKALGYVDVTQAIRDNCKKATTLEELRGVWQTPLAIKKEAVIIPESDLYRLIMRSKLPSAEAFQDWIFEEVLPQIRKTGKYAPTQEQLLLEHINTAVAGLKAMHNMSYKDKLTAARECLKEGIDITDDVPNKLLDDLKYFTLRELTKRSAYIKEAYLREALCDGGLLQKNGELTETGRYYGRYNSWGMPTFRLEALEYTLDTSTLRCWNR